MNCSAKQCTGRATRRSFCTKHYQRWRRHGAPEIFRPDAARTCAVNDCPRAHYARKLCRLHYDRWRKTGDPQGLRLHFSPLAGKSASANPMWRGDDVEYQGVHIRLRKERGPASRYACVMCGQNANDWAYDHRDPDERRGADGLVYSVRPGRYIPLCRSCHRNLDFGNAVWSG